MKKFILLVFTTFVMAGFTFGQDKIGSGDVTKSKSRGGDPNIKMEKRMNTADMETQAIKPAEKGARADARGAGAGSCYVYFENFTNWYIDCYVDGYYEGYMAPYGDGSLTVGSGNTCLYAIAEFDDGSRVSWGPVCKDCYYNDFELEVWDDFYNWYLD